MSLSRRTATLILGVASALAFLGSARPRAAHALEHPPEPHHAAACTRELVVPQTEGASGCWIDEHVTAQPGTLDAPCDGSDGEAQAVFGDRHFAGKLKDGVAHLVLHTQFHYSDGCDWGTTQTIDGSPASGHLTYGYHEFPLPGQHGCAGSCSATGDVRVH